MFMGWDAVQSEAGRDSILENDANADKKAIQLTLKVTDDKVKTPDATKNKKTKKAPETGDITNLPLYASVILLAVGSVIALSVIKRRKVR